MSKKLIIPKGSLPDINTYTEKYEVRFRITTEDRNRFSYWSPIFSVDPEFIYVQGSFDIPGNLVMQKHSGYVASIWDNAGIYKNIDGVNTLISALNEYDFWVQYAENGGANESDWFYKERLETNSTNENIPATYTDSNGVAGRVPKWMRVEVYRPGRPIARYSDLTVSIVQSGSTVDITNDTIVTASAHGLETGDTIVYTATSAIGGLTTDTAYWVRYVSSTTFSLYNHRSEAINNANKINLTSTGSNSATFTRYPFLLYKNKLTNL